MTADSYDVAAIDDLLLIAISIHPREVERLLDSLAELPHYINPILKYAEGRTTVEFPAYRAWLQDVYRILARDGHDEANVQLRPPLYHQEIHEI